MFSYDFPLSFPIPLPGGGGGDRWVGHPLDLPKEPVPEIIVADVELISALAPSLPFYSTEEDWIFGRWLLDRASGLEENSLAAIRKFGKPGPDFYDLLVRPANF